jgi:hypothetical protein
MRKIRILKVATYYKENVATKGDNHIFSAVIRSATKSQYFENLSYG